MTHHTTAHTTPHPPDRYNQPHEANSHVWVAIINIATAVVALALYRLADVGLVVAITLGFAAAATTTAIAYALTNRPRRG
jgi:hypothetical protein